MYRVLLLDGDNSSRFGLRRFPWGKYGFEITGEANSAHEALAKLATTAYDLLVTDIRLPDMDGLDFLAEVHREPQHPCTVLLSSCADFEYAQRAISMGVFDYMTKPLSSDVFGALLQRAGIYLSRRVPVAAPVEKKPEDRTFTLSESEEHTVIAMLLEGDRGFERALLEWDRSLVDVPMEQRERLIGALLDRAEQELSRTYPWLYALEDKQAAPAAFLQRAAQLTQMVKRFELAQEKSLLRSICSLVYQHIEEDVSLHGVAAELGISSDYAGRVFKRKTGLNFITFVTRLKMERGKELLEAGGCKNYEISTRLGYSNPDYFRQLFKAHTGMTPTEYRTLCHGQVFA